MTNGLQRNGIASPFDTEQAVLSAILHSSEIAWQVQEFLPPLAFTEPAHKEIYMAVRRLLMRDVPVDVFTVSEELRKSNVTTLVGGQLAIADLFYKSPSPEDALHHARVVYDEWLRRLVREQSVRVAGVTKDETKSGTELVSEFISTAEFIGTALNGQVNQYDGADMLQMVQDVRKAGVEAREQGIENTDIQGYKTGMYTLDEAGLRICNGDLIIIAARPSMGKTALGLCLANNIAESYNAPVDFYSFEMTESKIALRLASVRSRIPVNTIKGGLLTTPQQAEYQKHVIDTLPNHPLRVIRSERDLERLRITMMQTAQRNKTKLIVIDYISLIKVRGERKDIELGMISKALVELAKKLNIPIVLLSQLNRDVTKRGGGFRPTLADLKNSGDIEEDADVVLLLHRPEYYGITSVTEKINNVDTTQNVVGLAEVIIAKYRDNPTDSVWIGWDAPCTRFYSDPPYLQEEPRW